MTTNRIMPHTHAAGAMATPESARDHLEMAHGFARPTVDALASHDALLLLHTADHPEGVQW